MNYTVSRILGWIADNKLLTFLSICLFSFVIATIALASQKNSLQDKLNTCEANAKTTVAPPTEPSKTEAPTEPPKPETTAPTETPKPESTTATETTTKGPATDEQKQSNSEESKVNPSKLSRIRRYV